MSKCVKYVLNFYWLMIAKAALAADQTGIQGLDNVLSTGQRMLKVFARWGGVAIIVIAGFSIYKAKSKDEAVGFIVYLLIACGLIIAAFGWWDSIFTSGFAF